MTNLQSKVEATNLRIHAHVLDFVWAAYSTCVVISNGTDEITALLYFVPAFLQEGLEEQWMRAGKGTTVRFISLHILFARLEPDLCSVLLALYSLT